MTIAAFKCQYVVLDPVAPGSVPVGALFLDSTNGNAATVKTTGGGLEPTGSGATNLFVKQMVAGGAIAVNKPLSKRPDGKVVQGDADGVNTKNQCGFSQSAASADGDLINVLCNGPNIVGALTGLGFASGDTIYMSQTGGYTNDGTSFTNNDDRIIKLGIADCAAGVASATATDLIAFTQVDLYEP